MSAISDAHGYQEAENAVPLVADTLGLAWSKLACVPCHVRFKVIVEVVRAHIDQR